MSTALLERPSYDAELWEEDEDASHECPSERPLDVLSPTEVDGREDPSNADLPFAKKLLFDELADELADATRGLSSTRRASRHPAYDEILALGDIAIPWLLERLEVPGDRPLWLRLLGSLTHFQPGAGRDTISDAATAWITWGKLRSAH